MPGRPAALTTWPRKLPWSKVPGRLSLAGAPWPRSGDGGRSGFKFRMTVSVAPRPEDSEAKQGRGAGACAGGCTEEGGARVCTWVIRDEKEKLMGLGLETLKGTERDGFSPRHRVRLLRGNARGNEEMV